MQKKWNSFKNWFSSYLAGLLEIALAAIMSVWELFAPGVSADLRCWKCMSGLQRMAILWEIHTTKGVFERMERAVICKYGSTANMLTLLGERESHSRREPALYCLWFKIGEGYIGKLLLVNSRYAFENGFRTIEPGKVIGMITLIDSNNAALRLHISAFDSLTLLEGGVDDEDDLSIDPFLSSPVFKAVIVGMPYQLWPSSHVDAVVLEPPFPVEKEKEEYLY